MARLNRAQPLMQGVTRKSDDAADDTAKSCQELFSRPLRSATNQSGFAPGARRFGAAGPTIPTIPTILIRRWALDPVDNEHVDGRPLRVQF